MIYKKLSVQLTPYNEDASQIMMAQLGECGFDTFTETETGFEAYAAADNVSPMFELAIVSVVEGVKVEWTMDDVEDQDWNQQWEENSFKPICIDGRCRIRSPYHEPDDSVEYEVVINPKMSFGTGYHETTTMMVKYIMENDMAQKVVLDMGCGTGILGILASKRGAKHVDGVDIDEWSYRNAAENISLNGVGNMTPVLGGAEVLSGMGPYDVVFANINRNILVRDMQQYCSVLKPEGCMFFSGFYSEDAPIVVAEAEKYGLRLVETKEQNNWNGLFMKR